jgi:hypothetical protein
VTGRPTGGDVAEALEDVRTGRDRLREILPALVVASQRYEGGDGILTDPCRVVAEIASALDAAAALLDPSEGGGGEE